MEFWRHAVVGAAEIDADKEAAGEKGDLGGFLLFGEGNEVFPCGTEFFRKKAFLPKDPTGGGGAEGVAVKEPLGMVGKGGDPAL